MRCPTWIWVVLWLACLGTPGVAGLQFAPLAVPIALPETLRGKAIWALGRLPDGRLAAGFEGGIALGVPGGSWTIVPSPNGSPIQLVVAAHGRILAAGGSCAGFVENAMFASLPGIEGQILTARAVPEGWLLAGPAGLWLATPAGDTQKLAAAPVNQIVAGDDPTRPFVLFGRLPAQRWTRNRLEPAPEGALPRGLRLQCDGLWLTR
ncbi:MAG TPA: hypothetical protein VK178_02200, partial [Opitutaceae bacterium]|nr:hypothetical protein [Opitutaceae bacterium]